MWEAEAVKGGCTKEDFFADRIVCVTEAGQSMRANAWNVEAEQWAVSMTHCPAYARMRACFTGMRLVKISVACLACLDCLMMPPLCMHGAGV